MKVLITGSEGFIGKSLTTYLQTLNYQVYGLDKIRIEKPNFKTINILKIDDLFDYLNEISPEIVIHLAARIDISSESVIDYQTNTIGVLNLIKVTEGIESIRRVIWTSSQLVNKLGIISQDTNTFLPTTSYGESKAIGEMLVRNYSLTKEWVIVRPTNVWGPGFCKHYQNLLNYIDKGVYFNVTFSKIYKSYSYIGNICHQYEKLITANSINVTQKTFYLCDYEPIEVRSWINSFARKLERRNPVTLPFIVSLFLVCSFEIFGKIFGIKHVPLNLYTLNNIKTQFIVHQKELKLITGELPFDLETGVTRTIEWFKTIQTESK